MIAAQLTRPLLGATARRPSSSFAPHGAAGRGDAGVNCRRLPDRALQRVGGERRPHPDLRQHIVATLVAERATKRVELPPPAQRELGEHVLVVVGPRQRAARAAPRAGHRGAGDRRGRRDPPAGRRRVRRRPPRRPRPPRRDEHAPRPGPRPRRAGQRPRGADRRPRRQRPPRLARHRGRRRRPRRAGRRPCRSPPPRRSPSCAARSTSRSRRCASSRRVARAPRDGRGEARGGGPRRGPAGDGLRGGGRGRRRVVLRRDGLGPAGVDLPPGGRRARARPRRPRARDGRGRSPRPRPSPERTASTPSARSTSCA